MKLIKANYRLIAVLPVLGILQFCTSTVKTNANISGYYCQKKIGVLEMLVSKFKKDKPLMCAKMDFYLDSLGGFHYNYCNGLPFIYGNWKLNGDSIILFHLNNTLHSKKPELDEFSLYFDGRYIWWPMYKDSLKNGIAYTLLERSSP